RLDKVIALVERIQSDISQPLQMHAHDVFPSACVGIVFDISSYDTTDDILRDADTALHNAKSAGRSTYAVFDRAMHAQVLERLQLEVDLRHALERGEFSLEYQPVVELSDGLMACVEALVRWHHPGKGLLSPALFVPLAEETGLVHSIGEWALREACRQTMIWHAIGRRDMTVAVNISAWQLRDPHLKETVTRILAETGLPPHNLVLELTESSAIEQADASIAGLHDLKSLGLKIAIDDFGTGYSSLSYLKKMPIDYVKIDRSFVHQSTSGPNDAAIVLAIIDMAHHLGLQVVAEGVEHLAQASFLYQNRCDAAQGYLFSKPLPAEILTPLLVAETRRLQGERHYARNPWIHHNQVVAA
ncbi:MAG TPA: GGDEF domain-containing phosphodiesterase, partial [Roseiflexaceae bacterium]|nr:GGDEF domain-containing phosphodiesterase [Roseiflexaceae bacterium]